MNQITEALAEWDTRKGIVWQQVSDDSWAMIQRGMEGAAAYVAGWVTCPTCKGRELDIPLPAELTEPCPDCVDGMIPSPELIDRLFNARVYNSDGHIRPDVLEAVEAAIKRFPNFDAEQWIGGVAAIHAVRDALASRREGETR